MPNEDAFRVFSTLPPLINSRTGDCTRVSMIARARVCVFVCVYDFLQFSLSTLWSWYTKKNEHMLCGVNSPTCVIHSPALSLATTQAQRSGPSVEQMIHEFRERDRLWIAPCVQREICFVKVHEREARPAQATRPLSIRPSRLQPLLPLLRPSARDWGVVPVIFFSCVCVCVRE